MYATIGALCALPFFYGLPKSAQHLYSTHLR